jgi:hypothetical protein
VICYVMASIHKDSRFPKGPWICHFTRADGMRAKRSTGKHNRKEALIVCQALQQTEDELTSGDLSRDRLQEIFNETLKRLGEALSSGSQSANGSPIGWRGRKAKASRRTPAPLTSR